MKRTIWYTAATIAALALSGCAVTIPIGTQHGVHVSAPEQVFQVLNAVDFATTVSIARNPRCYEEVGEPTEKLIGSHPSESSVYKYWAGYSLLHLGVSSWLDREVDATDATGWKVAQRVFQVLSIGSAAYSVERNWHMGLRPFQSSNICSQPTIEHTQYPPPHPREQH